MSFDRSVRYPTKWLPPTGSFPFGVPKNSTTETSKDGSPYEKDFISDTEGFFQGMLSRRSVSLSGNPDTALISDYLDALGLLVGLTHATIADAKADVTLKINMLVRTIDNNSTERGGGADYLVKTTAQAISDGDFVTVPDEKGNHTSAVSGFVLILQYEAGINIAKFGAIKGADNTASIQACINFACGDQTKTDLVLRDSVPDHGNFEISLGGFDSIISQPLDLPRCGGVLFYAGSIKHSGTFPLTEETFNLAVASGSDVDYVNVSFEHITIDCNERGGGFLIERYLGVTLENVFCSRYSIHGLKTDVDGHELKVDKCWFGQHIFGDANWNNPINRTATGIILNTPDNEITNTVLFYNKLGALVNGQFNSFDVVHIYQGGITTLDMGIDFVASTGCSFDGGYIDNCYIRTQDPFNHKINNNTFLTNTSDISFDFIVLKPLAAGRAIRNLVITGNNFTQTNSGVKVDMLAVDTSSGGFDVNNIHDTIIGNNGVNADVNPKTTKPRGKLFQNAATDWVLTFNDLPFGNIQWANFSVLDTTGNFRAWALTAVSGNSVTVSSDLSTNATVYAEVDVNQQ